MKRLLSEEPTLFGLDPFRPSSQIEMKSLGQHNTRPMIQNVSLPFALAIDQGNEIWVRVFRHRKLIVYVSRGKVPFSSPINMATFHKGVWRVPPPICVDCAAYDGFHSYDRIAYNEDAFQQVLHAELPECCQDEAQNISFFKADGHRYSTRACFNGPFKFNELNMDIWGVILSYLFHKKDGAHSWFYRMPHGTGCVDFAFRTFLYSLSSPNYDRHSLYLCDTSHGSCVGVRAIEMMEEIRQVLHI